MDPKDWIAIYAAIVATVGMIWQIFTWWRAGPRVRAHVRANMITAGGAIPDANTYVVVTLSNVGTQPTTIQGLYLSGYPNRWARMRRRAARQAFIVGAQPAPPFVLEVGKVQMPMFVQSAELEQWSREHLLYVDVAHSFSKRSINLRLAPITPTDRKSPAKAATR